jgi:hypothetical protein
MKRHIKHLGLKNVTEYREWCRNHGFRSELSKNLRQIDLEIRAKDRTAKGKASSRELADHLGALGLAGIAEYRHWCRAIGVSDSLHKSTAQRRREVDAKRGFDFERDRRKLADTGGKIETAVRGIVSGDIQKDRLTNPGLIRLCELLAEHQPSSRQRAMLTRLVLTVLPKADFLDLNPVIGLFGSSEGNTSVDGLYAISAHSDQWQRIPESWKPVRHGLHNRFGELLRHLFALYPLPVFFDSVWFAGVGQEATKQQQWYVHVGRGGNIRTAGLPMAYTKRMAHLFLQAPDDYSVTNALRWGQVLALGGTRELVEHLNATPLGSRLEHEDFWISLIHFLVNNPMMDMSSVGPVVDYIEYLKFRDQDAGGDDGGAEVAGPPAGPPDPGFSMKGRTADSLLDLVDAWHRALSNAEPANHGKWLESGFPGLEFIEEDVASGHTLKWTITELVTRGELFREGKAMKHCVRSYLHSCAKGTKSVWSLKREDIDTGTSRRVLTIALKNDMSRVVQARGKCNAMAGMRPNSRQESAVLKREEDLLERGRRIMNIWADENGITVPRYT